MNPEWAIALISIVAGAVGYGVQLGNAIITRREIREIKEILAGENGLVKRVEILERHPHRFSAASGD